MDVVLEQAVVRWRDARLIDPDTARAIRAFEDERAGPDAVSGADEARPDDARPDDARSDDGGVLGVGRAALLAEGLAYLGAALAFGAGFALFADVWRQLGELARVLTLAAGTLALGGAAASLAGAASDALSRLRSLLAALALLGLGSTIGYALSSYTSLAEEELALAAAGATLAAAVPVHRLRPSWPTTIMTWAAALGTVLALEAVLGWAEDELTVGATLVGLGLAWAALGWARTILPRTAVEVTGLLTVGVGVELLAFDRLPVAAPVIGLLVAGGAIAVGVVEERTAPAVLGGLGVTVLAPQLVLELFGDTVGGPLALFVGGVALVGVAVTIVRQRSAS